MTGRVDHPKASQDCPDYRAQANREWNGEHTAEQVADDRSFRQTPPQIVGRDIQTVGNRHKGIQEYRVGGGVDIQRAIEDHHFDQVFEQRHGEAGVEQRIGKSVPTHITVPFEERRTPDAPRAQHRLENVAESGDAKPDKGAAIGQQPPLLGQEKGRKGWNEPDQDLQAILQDAVQIPPGDARSGSFLASILETQPLTVFLAKPTQ